MSAKSSQGKRSGSAEGAATAKASSGEHARAGGPGRGLPEQNASERSPEKQNAEKRSDPDVAIVCGVSDDGNGVDIIRRRGERIEAGTVRRLEQGKPIHGEVVRLRPREHFPLICDVEVEVPAPAQPEASSSTSGPAQVATETYRKNWDAIYGRSKKQRSLLN